MKKSLLKIVAISVLVAICANADESKLSQKEMDIGNFAKDKYNEFVTIKQVPSIVESFKARKEFFNMVKPRANKYPKIQNGVNFITQIPIVNQYCVAGLLSQNTQMINTCYDHVDEIEYGEKFGSSPREHVLENLIVWLGSNNQIAKSEKVAFKLLLEYPNNMATLHNLSTIYFKNGYKVKFKDNNERGVFAYLLLQRSAKLGYGPAIRDLGSDVLNVKGQNLDELLKKYSKQIL